MLAFYSLSSPFLLHDLGQLDSRVSIVLNRLAYLCIFPLRFTLLSR